jgi:hypothetical protein
MLVSHERLLNLLDYYPETGLFMRKAIGKEVVPRHIAGCINSQGYRIIKIDGRAYKAHRLAWLYVHKEWPASDIDHANMNRSDNRLSNLRSATRGQNVANSNKRSNNSSGFRGVSFHKSSQKWVAQIGSRGRKSYIGLFSVPKDAASAYNQAALARFGEFATLNPTGET